MIAIAISLPFGVVRAETTDRVEAAGASLVLPAGWRALHTGAAGATSVASFPTSAEHRPGTVVLRAADAHAKGSLFVVKIPERLQIGDDLQETLAVAAPEAFRRLWGVDYRVVWAAVSELSGRPTLQIQGAFTHEDAAYASLIALVPAGEVHYVVAYTVAATGDAPLGKVRASLATLRVAEKPGAFRGEIPRGLVGAGAGAVVGLFVAFGLRRRRAAARGWAARRRASGRAAGPPERRAPRPGGDAAP